MRPRLLYNGASLGRTQLCRCFARLSMHQNAAEKTASPPAQHSAKKRPPKPLSSCVQGTTLRGLNVLKSGQDPIALADEEYPTWLWQILEAEQTTPSADAEGGARDDEALHRRMQRRKSRSAIKTKNFLKSVVK